MNELSRIEIAFDLLEEAYNLSKNNNKEYQIETLYYFLTSNENDKSTIDDTLCYRHSLDKQLLNVYKKDAWLIALLDSYEYLKHLSISESISEKEKQILTELDSLEFTFTHLYAYFKDVSNKPKIKIILSRYYEYMKKGNEFIESCREYNFDNQTPFRNALTDYIENVEAMDFLCILFDQLDEKYQKQINELVTGEDETYEEELLANEEIEEDFIEDDIDEDEYQSAMDEMFDGYEDEVEQILNNFQNELFDKTMDWLEDYFDDKYDSDNFIGFFISYVYQILLNKQNKSAEEESLLKLMESTNDNYELLIESFYDNKEYVFVLLDNFTKTYYENQMDILTIRDTNNSSLVHQKMNSLDEHYPSQNKYSTYKLISSPLYEIYDMVFMKYKMDYPDDYLERLFYFLMDDSTFDSVFYELDVDGNLTMHRVLMIRYFTRKFLETIHQKASDVTEVEMGAYIDSSSQPYNLVNIINNFAKNGIQILKGYEYCLKQTDIEFKQNIRRMDKMSKLKDLVRVDPMVIGDSNYYRALTDSPLYQYVENNGIDQTVRHLSELAKKDYSSAKEYINELMVSIYSNAKEKNKLALFEQTIVLLYESENNDVDKYIMKILGDYSMLSQLIFKYYEAEKNEDFPIAYEDRVVKFPKVKQKLYPYPDENK